MVRIIPNQNTWVGFTTTAPGLLSVPGAPTATGSGTGGTLAANTYNYKITATNANGETTASAVSNTVTTTGTTSSVGLTWSSVTGATGYKVYGRNAGGTGGWLFIASTTSTSYTDTGSITPAGAVPGTNTAYSLGSPHVADITGAIDLTHFLVSLNAMSQGNAVPTPSFDTLFETTILGTSQATFTADFYRDSGTDTAWLTLPRSTAGYFLIARYGGIPSTIGNALEVWPVTVLSRAMANMSNNTVETFTVTCAVPVEPNEAAVVVA